MTGSAAVRKMGRMAKKRLSIMPHNKGQFRPGGKRWQIPDIKRAVCNWVAQGKTLRAWCRLPGRPQPKTIYKWLKDDLQFAEKFREARAVGYDMMAQGLIDVAETRQKVNGKIRHDDVAHRRLVIDTYLKLLARWDCGRYGDKLQLGGDGEHPIKVLSDDEAMTKIMELLAKAKTRQLRDPKNRLTGSETLN